MSQRQRDCADKPANPLNDLLTARSKESVSSYDDMLKDLESDISAAPRRLQPVTSTRITDSTQHISSASKQSVTSSNSARNVRSEQSEHLPISKYRSIDKSVLVQNNNRIGIVEDSTNIRINARNTPQSSLDDLLNSATSSLNRTRISDRSTNDTHKNIPTVVDRFNDFEKSLDSEILQARSRRRNPSGPSKDKIINDVNSSFDSSLNITTGQKEHALRFSPDRKQSVNRNLDLESSTSKEASNSQNGTRPRIEDEALDQNYLSNQRNDTRGRRIPQENLGMRGEVLSKSPKSEQSYISIGSRGKARSKSRSRAQSEQNAIDTDFVEIEPTVIVDENVCTVINDSIQIIDKNYIRALMQTLRSDPTPTPNPEDFVTEDGHYLWEQTIGVSVQEVLCEILKSRFVTKKELIGNAKTLQKPAAVGVTIKLFFKVVEARGLMSKEKKSRDAYCIIEYGNLGSDDKKKKDCESFTTEVITGTNNPIWNQHVTIPTKNLTDKIFLHVWDRKKDDFLGCVRLNMSELITCCAKEGYVRRWHSMGPRDEKKKDRFVGGEILLEFSLSNEQPGNLTASSDPAEYLQSQLLQCRVSFKSLYRILLRNCLVLDMNSKKDVITDISANIQTEESIATLAILGSQWAVGEAFRTIAYLDLLFSKYKLYEIKYGAIMSALESVHSMRKKSGWLGAFEKETLVDLLDDMYTYAKTQVSKYKDFYPQNKPPGALPTTIFMLRMIHKNPIFLEAFPLLPVSFKDVIKKLMIESIVSRYQKLQEYNSALDESDIEGVIEGLVSFVQSLCDDIDADIKYYKESFLKENIEIDRLCAESYLKSFVTTLEVNKELLASDEAASKASKSVFALYRKLRFMDTKYGRMTPGANCLSTAVGFDVEKWFAPFVLKWLDNLSSQTIEWVNRALSNDNFNFIGQEDEEKHSSSIIDLFSVVYQELDFISNLQWSDLVQSSKFLQKFAKTVNGAIDQYCEAIALGEIKMEQSPGTWSSLAVTAFTSRTASGPVDISLESCVKLCNIEYAMLKLEEMYRMMKVESLTKNMKEYKETLKHPPTKYISSRGATISNTFGDSEKLSGQIKLQIAYAENLKPCNKNGLANPYLIIRVPEGTLVPSTKEDDSQNLAASTDIRPSSSMSNISRNSSSIDKVEVTLTGKECELVRSRVVYDALNAAWDETFQCILPPVDKLEITANSKNLISFDELVGKATLNLSRGSRLRRELGDHQTHDVFIDIEPQGRVLLRLTLEGEDEDVHFWFRRSRERLGRTRDDFVRALTSKISPYARLLIMAVFRKSEAVALPAKSYFSSLVSAVEYSDKTADGISILREYSGREADEAFEPLEDYLDKNLSTLCVSLSTTMAQELVKRIWDEILIVMEFLLIAPLYGQIERERRVLNRRQISVAGWTISILKDFFHADGNGMGIPLKVLESRKYSELMTLIKYYQSDISRIRREYEMSLLGGKEKEYFLKLLRLRMEKEVEINDADREDLRQWFTQQLDARRERSRRSFQ